ncbi:hypothetical protein PI124_g14143 [Phytophthora idaei]|nr:hypothetical protein PI125_g23539 [Phytophthora idaei]KAG3128106.1 hypothetical protein PI126_g21541 [Phytophthora idaei]KAG3240957.1 hypothetical protein PI124_g14143 [Phytophthora idaei]
MNSVSKVQGALGVAQFGIYGLVSKWAKESRSGALLSKQATCSLTSR